MPKLTPIQQSFSAGEISPLMYMRSESEGYQQGVADMTNMFPDSRGAAYSRTGMSHITEFVANHARIIAVPVNDLFFYTGIFTDQKLTISSSVGHVPNVSYTVNSNFNFAGANWVSGTDGHASSTVVFEYGGALLDVAALVGRYAYVSQQFTIPSTGLHSLLWSFSSDTSLRLKIGTTENGNDVYDGTVPSGRGDIQFNATSTTLWVTAVLEADGVEHREVVLQYIGVSGSAITAVEFTTPYDELDLETIQTIASPSGGDLYIVHESYPPYKLTYDVATDSFAWQIVVFLNDDSPPVPATPPEWVAGSYPSCGDFFEGRLWLGGTVNEPQTFWGSKSGLPETFVTVGTGVFDDDPLEFTMAKYGRIEWMVGFKNMVIGTQNGEHIVSSQGGYISPSDIQVQQQSSYGSANIQPVQVGDQIFYVSADRRKLRAIQYEWQKDNWLSKDLTFNSEHITKAGIAHIAWQQNPNNLFHCVLNDGTVASMTYERSHDIYGWSKVESQGVVQDVVTAPVRGTDLANVLVKYKDGYVAYEGQSVEINTEYMDSWVTTNPESDGVTVTGLDHLEGFEVQVQVNKGTHPDRTVSGGQITLNHTYPLDSIVSVGLAFTAKLITLPFDKGAPSGGSGAGWIKRWNKIYIRVLDSFPPLINGERTPERHPSTPMGTPQPNVSEEIHKVNLGHSNHAIVTIEQDLPKNITVLGVFGELSQSIT